ncbi:Spc97 / Spc98 family protein [Cardiosporidium cionae]|uniref:Spc97 / Spc98 family protein n=1 Tax=Cardiosporidium cionae TaxID=476202 RepID=A0ABQ7JF89_9APIC|nr:Spc97 / Spc98 family protein [Cardiosporidium cionae]|eukprot:KAF8822619.1 Spc97 / Spc98 family protein [Cardiosporidium cionae]
MHSQSHSLNLPKNVKAGGKTSPRDLPPYKGVSSFFPFPNYPYVPSKSSSSWKSPVSNTSHAEDFSKVPFFPSESSVSPHSSADNSLFSKKCFSQPGAPSAFRTISESGTAQTSSDIELVREHHKHDILARHQQPISAANISTGSTNSPTGAAFQGINRLPFTSPTSPATLKNEKNVRQSRNSYFPPPITTKNDRISPFVPERVLYSDSVPFSTPFQQISPASYTPSRTASQNPFKMGSADTPISTHISSPTVPALSLAPTSFPTISTPPSNYKIGTGYGSTASLVPPIIHREEETRVGYAKEKSKGQKDAQSYIQTEENLDKKQNGNNKSPTDFDEGEGKKYGKENGIKSWDGNEKFPKPPPSLPHEKPMFPPQEDKSDNFSLLSESKNNQRVNAHALMTITSSLVEQFAEEAMFIAQKKEKKEEPSKYGRFASSNENSLHFPSLSSIRQHLEMHTAQFLASVSHRTANREEKSFSEILREIEMKMRGEDLTQISKMRQVLMQLSKCNIRHINSILHVFLELSMLSNTPKRTQENRMEVTEDNSCEEEEEESATETRKDPVESPPLPLSLEATATVQEEREFSTSSSPVDVSSFPSPPNVRKSEEKTISNKIEDVQASTKDFLSTPSAHAESSERQALALPTVETSQSVLNTFEFVGINETNLLRDIIFALQGVDGRYITYDALLHCYLLHPSVKVANSVRSIITHLCSMGTLYRRIMQVLEQKPEQFGRSLVMESFHQCVSDQLMEYYKLISLLENDVTSSLYSEEGTIENQLTLRRMAVWMEEPYGRMRLLAAVVNEVMTLKGGAILSAIYGHSRRTDGNYEKFMSEMLERSMAPLMDMIYSWMDDGELRDPCGEFFVVQNVDIPRASLWSHCYSLNLELVPQFIKRSVAEKILLAGKSVNFIRQCCSHSEWLFEHSERSSAANASSSPPHDLILSYSLETEEFTLPSVKELETLVDRAAPLKNKRFLLMGDGDFSSTLLENTFELLDQNASKLRKHSLLSLLESALRTGTAYPYSPNVIKCVFTEMHTPSRGDTGWDVFYLDYHVNPPMDAIFTQDVLQIYRTGFTLLWKILRTSYSLSLTWLHNLAQMKFVRGFEEVSQTVHECFLLRGEMSHLVTNLHSYFMYEVIDTAWKNFLTTQQKCSDLDELLHSHSVYLKAIQDGLFLSEDTDAISSLVIDDGDASHSVASTLVTLLEMIIGFTKLTNTIFFTACQYASENRSGRRVATRMKNEIFSAEILKELETTRNSYHYTVREFLDRLAGKQQFLRFLPAKGRLDKADKLQSLSCRLDFNGYYQNAAKRFLSFEEGIQKEIPFKKHF